MQITKGGYMPFIVYCATHLPSLQKYVGQTETTLDERKSQHYLDSKNPTKNRKRRKFGDLLKCSDPDEWDWSVITTCDTRIEARKIELHWIQTWGLYEHGLNSKTGPSGEALEALRKRMMDNNPSKLNVWNKGKRDIYSETTREKMRQAKYANPVKAVHTDQTRMKMRLSQPNSKKIICNETNECFLSLTECASKMKLNRPDIRKVLNGKRKHVHGFTFKLENKE